MSAGNRSTSSAPRYVRRRFLLDDDGAERLGAGLWADGFLGIQLGAGIADAYYEEHAVPPWRGDVPGVELLSEEVIAIEDWQASWRAAASPFALGERFWVDPAEPGEEIVAPPGRHLLRLPARRAFGTGSHATTRLAVEWLERIPLDGLDVLDLGAGSGVLSFVCRRLGARRAIGVERDLESVLLAGANRAWNGPHVSLVGGAMAALSPAARFDLVVANLLSSHLLPELPAVVKRLRPGGCLVHAGALAVEGRELRARFAEHDLAVVGERTAGEWASWRLRREPGRPPTTGTGSG